MITFAWTIGHATPLEDLYSMLKFKKSNHEPDLSLEDIKPNKHLISLVVEG